MEVTEGKVSKEQRGFREGKGCVDQIFACVWVEGECIENCAIGVGVRQGCVMSPLQCVYKKEVKS